MADLNQAQKSEVHETTDDAASSPASSFDAGAADAERKRNPDTSGAIANEASGADPGGRTAPRGGRDDAPPGATIESDESDDGGPIRIRTNDADARTPQ